MLPSNNSIERPNDLIELAIEVIGQSDRIFDENDYILFYGQLHQWILNNNLFSDNNTIMMTIIITLSVQIMVLKAYRLIPVLFSTDTTVNTFNDFQIHEIDNINLINLVEIGLRSF